MSSFACLILVPIGMAFSMFCYQHYYRLPEDNPVEEAVEHIILIETGMDIDLSSGSPEDSPPPPKEKKHGKKQ